MHELLCNRVLYNCLINSITIFIENGTLKATSESV